MKEKAGIKKYEGSSFQIQERGRKSTPNTERLTANAQCSTLNLPAVLRTANASGRPNSESLPQQGAQYAMLS
jgi:hypothetical protein